MKDIIDEVKEDLNNEAFSNIIKKYAKYVVLFVIAAVLITSVFTYIKHKNQEQQANLSKVFFSFYKNPQKDIPNDLKKSDKNIYSDLAYLESANALKNRKDYNSALEKLYDLSNKTKYVEIKNLAKIHAIFIVIDNKMTDEIQKMIKTFTIAKPEEPFGEVLNWSLAQLYIMNNDMESADNILKTLSSDPNSSPTMNEILKNSIINKK